MLIEQKGKGRSFRAYNGNSHLLHAEAGWSGLFLSRAWTCCPRYFTAAQEVSSSWRRGKLKPQLRLEGRANDPVGRSFGRHRDWAGGEAPSSHKTLQVVDKQHPASWMRLTRVVRWTLLLGTRRLGQLQDLGPLLCWCRLKEKP